MKTIKNILLIAALLTTGLMNTSCTDYQDEIDALDYRVTVLEELVKRVNTNLEALSVIVSAMEDGDYITNVRETEYGYLINFEKNGPIQIYDGKDAVSPQVRINPETGFWEISTDDGQTWTSTGTPASGRDGRDGEDGKDGRDGNQYIADFKYQIGEGGSFVVITTTDGSTFTIPIKQ